MKEKGHRNMYKLSVADYLFSILQKFNKIEQKLTEITHEVYK